MGGRVNHTENAELEAIAEWSETHYSLITTNVSVHPFVCILTVTTAFPVSLSPKERNSLFHTATYRKEYVQCEVDTRVLESN